MAKKLTITNTRPSYETLWYFETNSSQRTALNNWLVMNNDKVTFDYDFQNDALVQVLEYTFTDDAIAEEFLAFVASGNLGGASKEYNTSVGITSTQTITEL
jgi:hypothetical protein